METLTTKEFFEQLNSNILKQPFILKGIVRKSEKDSEVLFTSKGDCTGWTAIPASMIESVKVIKTLNKESTSMAEVILHLKAATTPEGKVLADLLSSAEQCNCNECNIHKSEHYGNAGGDNVCNHCGCHRDEHHCECGHKAEYRSNSCGFHGGHH
jgi:hypothetical protein